MNAFTKCELEGMPGIVVYGVKRYKDEEKYEERVEKEGFEGRN